MDHGLTAELMDQLLATTPDAVVVAGRDGTIQYWNAGAEFLFGFTVAEVMGQSLDLIIPERQRPRHWEGYDRVMETGVTKYSREMLAVPALHKDGSRISLEFTVTLLKDGDGKVAGIGAIMRNVTARFNQERELRKRIADLEAASAAAGAS